MHKPLLSFTVLLLKWHDSGRATNADAMNADGLKWGLCQCLPPGAQIAVVSGDPFKEGCTSSG